MAQTQAFGFGSAAVWATPTTDAYGNSIAVQTPLLLGTLQDVSVDFSSDVKELYGISQVPVMVAAGKMKISGKAKWSQVNMATIASLFFGQAYTSSTLSDYNDLTGLTVPATGPYYLNPTAPNNGTWTADLGVRDIYGNQWTKVASAPTGFQYAVTGPVAASQAATASFATNVMTVVSVGSGAAQFAVGQVITSTGVTAGTYITSLGTGTGGTGTYNLSTSPGTITTQAVSASSVYTLPATAASQTLFTSYRYTATSTINKSATFMNVAMGTKPVFVVDFFQGFQANALSMTLYQCVATKFSLATKIDDFLAQELDFAAFADGAGRVMSIGTSQ